MQSLVHIYHCQCYLKHISLVNCHPNHLVSLVFFELTYRGLLKNSHSIQSFSHHLFTMKIILVIFALAATLTGSDSANTDNTWVRHSNCHIPGVIRSSEITQAQLDAENKRCGEVCANAQFYVFECDLITNSCNCFYPPPPVPPSGYVKRATCNVHYAQWHDQNALNSEANRCDTICVRNGHPRGTFNCSIADNSCYCKMETNLDLAQICSV